MVKAGRASSIILLASHQTPPRHSHQWSSYKPHISNVTPQHCRPPPHLYLSPTDRSSYYVLSAIIGTVAVSYGAVPFYKMVRLLTILILITRSSNKTPPDLPTNRLGRPTDQITYARKRRRRSSIKAITSDQCAPATHNIQRVRLRCDALEIHPATARGQGSSW